MSLVSDILGRTGRATPAWVLGLLARWNECLLHLGPVLRALRVMPHTIGCPCVVAKMTQDQSARSEAARTVLGYRPRSLREMLRRNHEWLVETGRLAPPRSEASEAAPLLKKAS